jgi:hypothetical protein
MMLRANQGSWPPKKKDLPGKERCQLRLWFKGKSGKEEEPKPAEAPKFIVGLPYRWLFSRTILILCEKCTSWCY